MSSSQKKKAEKARRRALREKARKEERQRNVMTGIIVGVVVLIGAAIVGFSVSGDRAEEAELQASAEAAASEAQASAEAVASEAAANAPTEPVPTDPEAEPGVAVPSNDTPVLDERPIACDGTEPADAAAVRAQYPGGPLQVLEDDVDYYAVIETTCGTVEMDLLEDAAPQTVNSFVFLAEEGFFDGLEMFRNATSIGALQTGGGNQTNSWSIGYELPDELEVAETEGYPAGSVAMANAGPNTGGSQFFFIYNDLFQAGVDAGSLGPTFAVFGQITEGLDVVEQIGEIAVEGETPMEKVYMESVTIETR